jgi:hypothetical protein
MAAVDITAELPELADRLNTDADLMARVEAAIRQELGIDPKLTDLLPVPTHPQADLFERPEGELERGQHITVGPAGEIEGRFWTTGHCIIQTGELEPGVDSCWSPPPDLAQYNYFHQSDLTVSVSPDNAETVLYKAGLLVPGHSHPAASVQASQAHYNDPTNARAAVRAYDDSQGGIIRGSMLPGSTYADAILVRASALSGHWEKIGSVLLPDGRTARNEWVCLGPCLVGGPGLPLERGFSMTASVASVGNRRITGNAAPGADTAEPPTQSESQPSGSIEGLAAILDRLTLLESSASESAGLAEQLADTRAELESFKAAYYQNLEIEAPELEGPPQD